LSEFTFTFARVAGLLAENADPPAAFNPLSSLLVPLVPIVILFYLMIVRPQRARERNFKSLLSNLKKNDHVVTIGGIHGVVTNVQKEADRVTIRVDEATGTTLRVGLSAIGRVLTDEEENAAKPSASPPK
jgi:preprotein translocase subunit YajC